MHDVSAWLGTFDMQRVASWVRYMLALLRRRLKAFSSLHIAVDAESGAGLGDWGQSSVCGAAHRLGD